MRMCSVLVCGHVHVNAQNVYALVCRELKLTLGVFPLLFLTIFFEV